MFDVIIEYKEGLARLKCQTFEEAQRVRISFENYGGHKSIKIEWRG